MKKQMMIVIVIILVIAVILGIVTLRNNNSNKENVELQDVSQVKSMFNAIYSKLTGKIPSLEIEEIDISDQTRVQAYTGLKSNENVEMLVVSEPMMSSQAYSAVVVKAKNNADIETMKQEMLDNINTNKWICVSAGKVYVTSYDNIIFLVMADEDWANIVYNEFKNYVNNNVGKELEKNTEENFELPAEMLVTQ